MFKFVKEANAEELCRYLQNEISVLFQRADHPLLASDPLVNQLSLDEETRILKASIISLGSLNDRGLAVILCGIYWYVEDLSNFKPILKGSELLEELQSNLHSHSFNI
jgi:hypothetical protein